MKSHYWVRNVYSLNEPTPAEETSTFVSLILVYLRRSYVQQIIVVTHNYRQNLLQVFAAPLYVE
jgi:hypothetical protein